jgi:hypothetical protein
MSKLMLFAAAAASFKRLVSKNRWAAILAKSRQTPVSLSQQ